MRRLIKELRILAVQLRDDRPLLFVIPQRIEQKLGPPTDVVDMRELGEDHIGFSLASRHEPKGGIRDSIHGRETDHGRRKAVPKRHRDDSRSGRPSELASLYAVRNVAASRTAPSKSSGARSATNSKRRSILRRKKS